MEYFAHLGYPCPSHCNPADHLIDLVSTDYDSTVTAARDSARIEGLVGAWTRHTATAAAALSGKRPAGAIRGNHCQGQTPRPQRRRRHHRHRHRRHLRHCHLHRRRRRACCAPPSPPDHSSISFARSSISSASSIAADPALLRTTLAAGALRPSGSSKLVPECALAADGTYNK